MLRLPYFHWPTFYNQVCQQLYRSDWAVFVATMSVSALTAGWLNSGISMPIPFDLNDIRPKAAAISSECYAAAVKAMPSDITNATDYFQAMKASAILASVCLQNEDMKKTVAHLGDYISLSVMHGFYTEANWPVHLTDIERQERRRLVSIVFSFPMISSVTDLASRSSGAYISRNSTSLPLLAYHLGNAKQRRQYYIPLKCSMMMI